MRREHREFEYVRVALIRRLEGNQYDSLTEQLKARYWQYGDTGHIFCPRTYTHDRQRRYCDEHYPSISSFETWAEYCEAVDRFDAKFGQFDPEKRR